MYLCFMNKLLVVCGPTGVGKTRLALQLAQEFNGELISADSRQIYKYMDIVTGKDVPKELRVQSSGISFRNKLLPYYSDGRTRIWGYDVVQPDEEWSVKHFVELARVVIEDIRKRKKLPIIVGGTGLYLKALTEPIPLISIPRDLRLRQRLEKKSTDELFALLNKKWPSRARITNESDRKNPRRLIRAIEIAEFQKDCPSHTRRTVLHKIPDDALWIGLTIKNRKHLYNRIDTRVDQRIGPRLWDELDVLKKKTFLGAVPAHTIGYQQWIRYLDGSVDKTETAQRWKFAEHAYARRQLTWFKKQPGIHWFNIEQPEHRVRVVRLVRRWYDEADGSRKTTTALD